MLPPLGSLHLPSDEWLKKLSLEKAPWQQDLDVCCLLRFAGLLRRELTLPGDLKDVCCRRAVTVCKSGPAKSLFPEVLTLRRCFPLPFELKPSELMFSGTDSFVIKFRMCVPFVHFVC